MLVIVISSSCGFIAFYDRRVSELAREGNKLLEKDAAISREWRDEFITVFTPENRARFPSNRDDLRPHAENLIRLLEQRVALNNEAAAKFDQAAEISRLEKEKKFASLMAGSLRKDVEINLLLLDQMRLVLDEEIKDQIAFNSAFMTITDNVGLKLKESRDLSSAARECMGRKATLSIPY